MAWNGFPRRNIACAWNDSHARHAQNDIPNHVIKCKQTKLSEGVLGG